MNIFETVLEMSASASIAIAAVLALRLVLKGAPKVFTWMLWLAVLVRLWCPVLPEVRTGVRVPRTDPVMVIEQAFSQEQPAAPTATVQQVQTPGQAETPREPSADPVEILAVIWAAGAASMASWGVVSDLRLRSRLRTAVRREDGVYLADGINGPFVTGLLLPKIYLPSDMDGAGERYILLHERRHIRCGDPIVKALFFGALCIHWFNPLVWLVCLLAERDMELRCDEGVFRKLEQEERLDYASALVACTARRRRLMPLAFGEGDTKRRVKNVLTYKKPKWWAVALAAVLCVTAAGCMLTEAEPEYDRSMLEYPGLSWGMSVDEVLDAMDLDREDIAYESTDITEEGVSQNHWEYIMLYQDLELLGQKASAVFFTFRDYSMTGENYVLTAVDACYPDGTDGEMADIAALAEKLTELYGERSPEYSSAYWNFSAGEPRIETRAYEEDEYVWNSELTAFDVMTPEQQEALYQTHCDNITSHGYEDIPTREEEQQIYDRPVCQITLYPFFDPFLSRLEQDLSGEQRELGLTNNRLTMSASGYFDLLYVIERNLS